MGYNRHMTSLAGQFLVASPLLLDPNFKQAVILILQHNEEGAMGLVINRRTRLTMMEAWKQVSQKPCGIEDFIYQGGPVEGPLMVLHTEPTVAQLSVAGVSFLTEAQGIEWLVEQGTGPMRFFVGYSGWGPGQLENELTEGSWLVAQASKDQIFENAEVLWDELTRQVTKVSHYPGIDPRRIPPDPSVN